MAAIRDHVELSFRRRGPRIGEFYDSYIKLMKDALPIGALLLILALLILPFMQDREFSFILDKRKVAAAGERLRMEAPLYRGTDSQGRAFVLQAARAVQKSSKDPALVLEKLKATLQMQDGPAELTADTGSFDLKKEQLTVSGMITLKRTDGYRFAASDVVVDLNSRTAWSDKPIEGDGPFGHFRAGSFKLNLDETSLLFGNRASLRITQ
jgi:lipopolysaccharide export system protein LptC